MPSATVPGVSTQEAMHCEPVTAIDPATQDDIMAVLGDEAAAGRTVIATTHDLACAAQRFQKVATVNRRVVAHGGPHRRHRDLQLDHSAGPLGQIAAARHQSQRCEEDQLPHSVPGAGLLLMSRSAVCAAQLTACA